MKKYLLWGLALLTVAACHQPFRTAIYDDNLAMPLAEDRADTLVYSLNLEYVVSGLEKEVCDQINNTILTLAFDLEEAPGTVEETAIRYRENLIDEYLTENSNPDPEGGIYSWGDEITGGFVQDWNGNKCYSMTYYTYRGGAHGLYTITYLVFNPQTGALLTEDDLFQEGYREPVSRIMQENLREAMKEDPYALESVWFDNVVPNGNFLPDENGVSWLFQPYDVAPYALGALSADVSWEQLKPYLK